MDIAAYLLLLAGAGLAGWSLVRRLGLDDPGAWALGRTTGLVAAAFPAWWWGSIGLPGWRALGLVLLAAGAGWGLLELVRRPPGWRAVLPGEAIFWGFGLAVLALRLPRPAIVDTEKLMDLGIHASLLRAASLPPADMWLAGESLPYYYWGAVPWTLVTWASRVPLEVAYNLQVAALAGVVAAAAWAVARQLGAGGGWALTAPFLAVLAGTPDGLVQLLGGTPVAALDLWASSRRVAATITEFPLFSFWLGDLHPHLLVLAPTLLALALGLLAGSRGPRPLTVALAAASVGVSGAANPWSLPPTLAAVTLAMVAGDGRWRWPWGPGGRRWLLAVPLAAGAFLAVLPFERSFEPPLSGLGLVRAWTAPHELLLHLGAQLVLPAAVLVGGVWSTARRGERPRLLVLGSAALAVTAAAASGRPTLVLLLVLGLGLLGLAASASPAPWLPGAALAVLALVLAAAPEVVFVVDPYGAELHRMNTVFKSWFQAWLLLAVAAPALLVSLPRRAARAGLLALVLALSLPHLVAAAVTAATVGPRGLDGLGWMPSGDRAAVVVLRRQPPGTVLVEAVGEAYSRYGRLSAASGVPALLGWANHERVWRGAKTLPELARREAAVEALYHAGDPARVRALAQREGVDLVAVGALERDNYPAAGLAAALQAGPHVLEGDTVLVRVGADD